MSDTEDGVPHSPDPAGKPRFEGSSENPGPENPGPENPSPELAALLYEDLRAIAASFFRREAPGRTLQPTALVHEAYMRLADQGSARSLNRGQFLSLAARMMRRVLCDAARARQAEKRGGDAQRVTLSEPGGPAEDQGVDPLELEEALVRLGKVSERFVKIVELRFFAGLEVKEIGEVLGVSERQVFKDWGKARSYLSVYLEDSATGA